MSSVVFRKNNNKKSKNISKQGEIRRESAKQITKKKEKDCVKNTLVRKIYADEKKYSTYIFFFFGVSEKENICYVFFKFISFSFFIVEVRLSLRKFNIKEEKKKNRTVHRKFWFIVIIVISICCNFQQ